MAFLRSPAQHFLSRCFPEDYTPLLEEAPEEGLKIVVQVAIAQAVEAGRTALGAVLGNYVTPTDFAPVQGTVDAAVPSGESPFAPHCSEHC